MKKLTMLVLSLLLVSLFMTSYATAGDSVVVIVNAKNTQSLTKQQIKNIYADITTKWDNGKQITVYHLPVDQPTRETFSQSIFGESAQKQASAELNRKITNNIKNPTKTKRARLVIKMISRNPNAIGYVTKNLLENAKNVKSILTIDMP